MISFILRRSVIALSCALTLFTIPQIHAQQLASARIIGAFTDPTGKVVQNVTVTLTNLAQGTVRSLETRTDGSFTFTTLGAAAYQLKVVAPGFATYEQTPHPQRGTEPQCPRKA